MAGPEYTKGKRRVEEGNRGAIVTDAVTVGDIISVAPETCWEESRINWAGNARLSAASDNAVIELAEHLGCNAVELAERLEGGGLVKLVEAVQRYTATVNALTRGHPDEAQSSDEARVALSGQIAATKDIAAALSHLTPAPR